MIPIDREALVKRHGVQWNDPEGVLPLGNGGFCFSVDGTGLHTLNGNAMARWAWHTAPMPEGFTSADVPPLKTWQTGRNQGLQQIPGGPLRRWMYDNPHSFSFARLRFRRGDGGELTAGEILNLQRSLDLWRGLHIADFTLDGVPVHVETCVHPDRDAVLTHVSTPLLRDGKLKVSLEFGYPLTTPGGWISDFGTPRGTLELETAPGQADVVLRREMDGTVFYVRLASASPGVAIRPAAGGYAYEVTCKTGQLDLACVFAAVPFTGAVPSWAETQAAAEAAWKVFWTTGGAVDFSGSRDPRWRELERRVVLSQYNMNAQGSGPWPNAEIGLMGVDGWAGQFHMEMTWWHLAHFALWGRIAKSDRALDCYRKFMPSARALAARLDYRGVMWPKSVGPEGHSAPWEGNLVLLWKQPHPVFFAELEYRVRPTSATLEKWAEIIEAAADFMADYPERRVESGLYSLRPVMPPGETGVTRDTVFDLAYWRWGLAQAQVWRERMGRPRVGRWDEVRRHLEPLPVLDGRYTHAPEWPETYGRRNYEHPDPVGVCGMLPPTEGVDPDIAGRSVRRVMETWNWDTCWGWDFPWTAMSAARTGQPHLAVDALLMNHPKNRYDERGICGGDYLPGNGGLLYAVAMMAAGWEVPEGTAPLRSAPGFPSDGSWSVRCENLRVAP